MEEVRNLVKIRAAELEKMANDMGQLVQANTIATVSLTEVLKKVIEAKYWLENSYSVLSIEIEKQKAQPAKPADAVPAGITTADTVEDTKN